jgi:hypothetical protein
LQKRFTMEAAVASLRAQVTQATVLSAAEVAEMKLLRDALNAILSSSSADFDDASVLFRGWMCKSKRKGNSFSRPKRRFGVLLLDGLHYFAAPFGEELGFIESSDIAEVRWSTQEQKSFVLATHDATYEITGDVRNVCSLVASCLITHRTTRERWRGSQSCRRQSQWDLRWAEKW